MSENRGYSPLLLDLCPPPVSMECDDSPRQRSTIEIMMYSASREDLKTVLEWLRGSDESKWQYQTTLLSDMISDLQRMARRSMESDFVPPGAAEINTALPHLTKMLSAMHKRNRPAASASGEAGLALLTEGA
jgi:hypothetical protein